MKRRIIAAMVCFGVMAQAQASEALADLALSVCKMKIFVGALLKHCSAENPKLATRAQHAYSRWLSVNEQIADRVEKKCEDMVSKFALKKNGPAGVKVALEELAQAVDQTLADRITRARKEEGEWCPAFVKEIESKESDQMFKRLVRDMGADKM